MYERFSEFEVFQERFRTVCRCGKISETRSEVISLIEFKLNILLYSQGHQLKRDTRNYYRSTRQSVSMHHSSLQLGVAEEIILAGGA